jgi:hypothetical protein
MSVIVAGGDFFKPENGYFMDAGSIMQSDTSIENLRAFTEMPRQYGAYSAGTYNPVSQLQLVSRPAPLRIGRM